MRHEGGWHRSVTGVVRRTLEAAFEDNIPFLASALSFDLLLTTLPFVILLLAVVGYLVQHQVTTHQVQLHELLARFLPSGATGGGVGAFEQVESALSGIVRHRGRLTLVGLPLFLWFSTRLFGGLRAALNEVFDTDEIRPWPIAKLIDLTMVFATGAVLVANALVAAYEARNAGVMSGSFALDWFWRFSMETVAFALGVLLFFLIFKILPSRRIQWQTALGRRVLLARLRSSEAAIRAVRGEVRHLRPRRLGRQRRRAVPVPAVGLLHGLPVPARRRGGGDLRPRPHAPQPAGPAGMTVIDLRSDTVTKPSAAMRRAIAEAVVGDDVLDGDPTTRLLERRVAELLGKEDSLFFPSGTQANQTGIALQTRPGTELILEANAHLVHYELAGVAALSGAQIRPVTTPDGLLTGELVRAALRPASPHVPRATAVAVENTHNAAGGKVMSPEVMAGIATVATQAGLGLHLDGARLWNAAAATGVPLTRLAAGAGTVMVSFSKGLGCPAGSCLAFRAADRALAWEIRKRLGGGMRQSGILAAAALYALDHHLGRLQQDHAHAKLLAELVADCPAVRPSAPETNIVMIDLVRERDTVDAVLPKLTQAGVLLVPFGPRRLRAVTHLDVGRDEVERAAAVIRRVVG